MLLTHFPKTPTGFVRGINRTVAPWHFPYHQHNGFLELVCVHRGELIHTVSSQTVRQKQGDLLMVRDFDGHELEAGNEEMLMSNLQVSNLWLRQIEILWENASLISGPLAKPAPLLVHLSPSELQDYEQGLAQLETPPNTEGRRAVFSAFFIHTLLTHFADPNLFGYEKEQMPDWLENTVSWIHQQREQPIRVADIVEHANKCPEHVSRCFMKYLKMTPSQYIYRQRLDYAAELLTGTNYPLLEVCYRAGFDNPSYFHRLFKRIFGQPPNAYRKANTRLETN